MRGTASRPDLRSDEPVTFNWHVGTLQPYSSLWLIMHRLALINQISIAEVRSLSKTGSFSTRMHSLTENTNTIDIGVLAAAIGERPQALSFSTMQPFAAWMHRYFLTTSIQYCPVCLALGFHSVFQCLKLMKRCPLHGEWLQQHCSCGAPISACVSPSLYRDAGVCRKCFLRFLDIRQARRPSMPEESLTAFDEVKDWLLGLGSRVSTMVSDNLGRQRPSVRVEATADLATRALSLQYPSCLVPEPVPPHAETVNSVQSPWASRGPESAESRTSPRRLVFCAVDRYLRRHVLRGQRWITKLAMHADAQYIAQQIAYEPDAFLAWTYLLWLMAVFESCNLRSIRSRDAQYAYQRGIRVPGCHVYKGPSWDVRTIEWLEYHAAETSLLAVWRDLHQTVLAMSRDEDSRWGPDIASGAGRFQWIGLQHTNGTVEFAAVQSMGVRFGYAVQPPKAHQRPSPIATPRKSDVALSGMSRRGLVKLPDGDWKAGSLTPPTKKELPQLKVHRLLHVDDPLHFIVVRRGGAKGYFAARLVEFGLEGRGADARAAVESLRIAVRQYTRQYGTPWKWPLSSAVSEDRLLRHEGSAMPFKIRLGAP